MNPTDRAIALLFAAAMAVLATTAPAHEGETDSDGCHHSEEEGYHCH